MRLHDTQHAKRIDKKIVSFMKRHIGTWIMQLELYLITQQNRNAIDL